MEKFKIGDRVQVVGVDESDVYVGIRLDDKGTVVDVENGGIGVRMDERNEHLHNCAGNCEYGHGRWFNEHQLVLIENETPEPLENWKHPHYGKPILVRDGEDEEWEEATFVCYVEGDTWPVVVSDKEGYVVGCSFYKFPEPSPEVPEYTMEELTKKLGHEFKIKK